MQLIEDYYSGMVQAEHIGEKINYYQRSIDYHLNIIANFGGLELQQKGILMGQVSRMIDDKYLLESLYALIQKGYSAHPEQE